MSKNNNDESSSAEVFKCEYGGKTSKKSLKNDKVDDSTPSQEVSTNDEQLKNVENRVGHLKIQDAVMEEVNDDVTDSSDEDVLETARRLGELGSVNEMRQLIGQVLERQRRSPQVIKAAKLVRQLFDLFLATEAADSQVKIQVCQECIQWATDANRSLLRRWLQARLVELFNQSGKYAEGLRLAELLLAELNKVDDKDMSILVHLEESKIFFSRGNMTRAQTSLTSSKSVAHSVHVPPEVQAQLDLQSGKIAASSSGEFKTAASYFHEALDQAEEAGDLKTQGLALKYVLLCKIVQGETTALSCNLHDGLSELPEIRMMTEIAQNARSLETFNILLEKHKELLARDPFVMQHLRATLENLVEDTLVRMVAPYSRVQVAFVAEKISLPVDVVERKLSNLILDRKLDGILDQETRVLILNDNGGKNQESVLENVIAFIGETSQVVDQLYRQSKRLT